MKTSTEKFLKQYVRDPKTGNPIGVVVATGKHNIGWSLCHKLDRNRYSKVQGTMIALNRAHDFIPENDYVKVPECVIPVFREMMTRAQKYFK